MRKDGPGAPDIIGVSVAIMKKLRLATLAAGLAAAASFLSVAPVQAQALGGSRGQTVDTIAAVVNNGVITRRELDERMSLITRRLNQQNAPVPPTDQLRQQVLNQMVLERIQLQKAKEDGINIDDATVQKTLERLAQANNLSLDVYRSRIEAQGVPWTTFTSDARTELTLSRLREKEVDSKVTVSDAEVANYIASQRGPNAGLTSDLHHAAHFLEGAAERVGDRYRSGAEEGRRRCSPKPRAAPTSKSSRSRIRRRRMHRRAAISAFASPSKLPPEFVKAASTLRPGQVNAGSDPHQRRLRNRAPRRAPRGSGHRCGCAEARANARAPHPAARRRRHVGAASASEAARNQERRSPRAATSRSSRTPIRKTVRRRKAATSAGSAPARRCRNSSAR